MAEETTSTNPTVLGAIDIERGGSLVTVLLAAMEYLHPKLCARLRRDVANGSSAVQLAAATALRGRTGSGDSDIVEVLTAAVYAYAFREENRNAKSA